MLDVEARQVGSSVGDVDVAAKTPVSTGEMDALLGGMVSWMLKIMSDNLVLWYRCLYG